MKHIGKTCLLTIILFNFLSGDTTSPRVQVEISYGELVDKITILTIKSERITDPEKLRNILTELNILLTILETHVGYRDDIEELRKELKKTNEALWDVEDILRIKERAKNFGDEFLQLARRVYVINDNRFILKKKIDTLLGSHFSEEKSYDLSYLT